MLTIKDAVQLYLLLKPAIPKNVEEIKSIHSFAGKIIQEIGNSERQEDLAHILTLVTNYTTQELLELHPATRKVLLTKGLEELDILSLVTFCKGLGL